MQTTRLLLPILLCAGVACHAASEAPRTTVALATDWTFNYLPEGEVDESVAAVSFDDSTWSLAAIPHTWQTYETTKELHPFIRSASERDDPYWWKGWGYYRKRFVVAEALREQLITIEFDGVQKYARIYLNGAFVGDHKGGYTSFYFDLTPLIRFGEENVLVVAASNRRDDPLRIPPMTAGNWNVYGGIYRDVRLVAKNKIHIPYQGSHRHEGGTFVTTPVVNEREARVHIKTYVKNDTEAPAEVTLKTAIVSPQGTQIETLEKKGLLASGALFTFEQDSSLLKQPQLWHPASPRVYRVESAVYVDGQLKDTFESPLGFRWFTWDFEKNDLWVNGERLPIRGMNRHQEYPWVGDAIPKWLTAQDYQDMRENLGINFIRPAHYPNDPQVLQLADQLGMVVVEEVPNIKSIDFDEGVQKQNVQEMIRRDRNHPSIFFWSVGNETSDAADSKWVVEEDQTRLVHARKAKDAGGFVDHDHTNLDMENLLRVTVRGFFDDEDAPQGRDLKPKDGQWCGTEAWQHEQGMIEDGSVRGSLKKNTVLWLYEDHGADREYKNSPLKHINYKGWVDLYRFPKYAYYLTQAMFTERPMVFIQPHLWTPSHLGQRRDFVVNSNGDTVELFVDGQKVGEARPTFEGYRTVTFRNIEVREGTLKAVATKGDTTVASTVAMSGKPARLTLAVSHAEIAVGKSGMAIVTADIVDENGNRVIHANPPLDWRVEGAASLIGPPRYETDFNRFEAMEGSGYIRVPVSNIIRSTQRPGKATITVSSPGLEPARVEVDVLPAAPPTDGIAWPPLAEAGRQGVVRREDFNAGQINGKELGHILSGSMKFGPPRQKKTLEAFTRFLGENNPEFDKKLPESIVFIDYFKEYFLRMNGELIGDDFNFMADQYNDCRAIAKSIEASALPAEMITALREEYARKSIGKGEAVNLAEAIGSFANLPAERMILRWENQPEKGDPFLGEEKEGLAYPCFSTDLERLVKRVYPRFGALSSAQQAAYLDHMDRINPHVAIRDGKTQFMEGTLICLLNPGK